MFEDLQFVLYGDQAYGVQGVMGFRGKTRRNIKGVKLLCKIVIVRFGKYL